MCGHATIALARWAVDSGRVARREPETHRAPAMSLRAGDGTRRRRRHGALRKRAGLRLCARSHRADPHLGAGDGRHRLWRRLLRDPCRRFDRPRSPVLADARHRRCRRGDHRGRRRGRPDRASRRARSRLPLRHHPDRRRRRRRQAQPQHLHLRRPPDRPQPDRQRRHRAHGAAGGAAAGALGRGAPVRELHRRGLQRQGRCARRRRSAAQGGDRRSRAARAHHDRRERAFASTTTIRCARASSLRL